VRQFIEMVNGTDSEVRCLGGHSPKSQDSYPVSPRSFSSPSMSPSHGMNIHNLATGKGSSTHFSGKLMWKIYRLDLGIHHVRGVGFWFCLVLFFYNSVSGEVTDTCRLTLCFT